MDVLDRLRLGKNPNVKKMLNKYGSGLESVVFSSKIVKVNRKERQQVRILLITDFAVYNLKPGDYSRCKRRIDLDCIEKMVISTVSDEFVIHVPDEYDYKLRSELKHEICELLRVLISKRSNRQLHIQFEDTKALSTLTEKPRSESLSSTRRLFFSKSSHSVSESSLFDNLEQTENLLKKEKIAISNFEKIKVLGRGAFGKVLQVRKKDTGKMYAMKVLKKSFLEEMGSMENSVVERTILEAFDNPFIMKLKYAFQTKTKLYIVMNLYSGGELLHHLEMKGRFSEDEARIITAEIVIALGHLHSLNFVYRDLKPENILMGRDGHICLTDFGLSKKLDENKPFSNTFVGTPHYIAPELLMQSSHGTPVDWWSLGIVLYELVVGVPPFHSDSITQIFTAITKNTVRYPLFLSRELKDLIGKLLEKDPSNRLGTLRDAEEVIQHSWFDSIDFELLFHKKIIPVYVPDLSAGHLQFTHEDMMLKTLEEVELKEQESLNRTLDFLNFTYDADSPRTLSTPQSPRKGFVRPNPSHDLDLDGDISISE